MSMNMLFELLCEYELSFMISSSRLAGHIRSCAASRAKCVDTLTCHLMIARLRVDQVFRTCVI